MVYVPHKVCNILYCLFMSNWREQANCRGLTGLMYSSEHRKARRVCMNCRVEKECLASSIQEENIDFPIYGVRAGMTAAERFRYRRRIME